MRPAPLAGVLSLALVGACVPKWDTVDGDGDGVTVADGDCWDLEEGPDGSGLTGADIHPSAAETWYDGVDQDCDGRSDFDRDGDGFVPDAYAASEAELQSGDCDDANVVVNPAALDEYYDGVDSDCSGNDDFDQDGDGYVPEAYAGLVTEYVEGSGELPAHDCDDLEVTVNPDADDEWYDGVDSDCGGEDDFDQDGDGYVPREYGGLETEYVDGSGNLPVGDCDDTDPLRYYDPTVPVVWYNGYDERCDENDGDQDGDGFWVEDYELRVEASGTGLEPLPVLPDEEGDCFDDPADRPDAGDPGNPWVPINGGVLLGPEDVHPGADDAAYDAVDADCGDDSDFDQDGDAFDSDCVPQRDGSYGNDCIDSDDPADCGDDDPASLGALGVYPGAIDTWYDGTDANCDDHDDWDQDRDGYIPDGYGSSYTGTFPDGDCDDVDEEINPSMSDTWYDGVDTDCSGGDDYDQDVDGYVPGAYVGLPTRYVTGSGALPGGDCDDLSDDINPGESDSWYDGEDTDCSGDDDYDRDSDGYVPDEYEGRETEYVSGSGSLPPGDCDDTDDAVHPGAVEVWYDGVDGDCDGGSDYDADGDGFDSGAYGGDDCDDDDPDVTVGTIEVWYDGVDGDCDGASDYDADRDGHDSDAYGGDDCDDTDAAISPDATEIWYDGVDQDCNDASDYDADVDGHDREASGGGDCDDTDAAISPDATEIWYDGVDQDCNDASDYDADSDGEDSSDYGGGDCDDGDAAVSTAAIETCGTAYDDDCDGDDNDLDATGCTDWNLDDDADSFGSASSRCYCEETGAWRADNDDDCDDSDPSIHPGASDTWYDGVDSDCAGDSDYDADVDGYDAEPYGGSDCDDAEATTHPGASESWYDGVDSDCDGASDFDLDGDGYDTDSFGGDDCDDFDDSVYPGATETWYDGVDGDCDDGSDYDRDSDGYDSDDYGGDDCDDGDASINPDATEVWYDGTDQDCAGDSDYDADVDGHDSEWYGGGDCDDTDATINPDATEVWYDGTDQDCDEWSDYDADFDGQDHDAYGGSDCDDSNDAVYYGAADTWYDGVDSDCAENDDFDRDADGYQSDSYGGDDCNDAVASINPGATEVWYDGTDKDCSGGSDYDADGDGDDHDGYGGTDCDDGDINIYGGAPDTWYDGVDSNCDGDSDYDADGDGDDAEDYGGTDCDDANPTRAGTLTEVAGAWGLDDDCDEYIDEDFVNVGDLILSEAMVNTIESAGTESTEWFEIYNTSDSTIYLDGWGFEEFMGGSSANGFFVSPGAGLTIDGDSYLVFCLSSGIAGLTCDYVYGTNAYGPSIHGDVDNGSWMMNNSGGTLTIALDSTTIDEVDISASFGYGSGISAELGFDAMDDSSNDVDTNWCAATNLYTSSGGDQYGTPNGVNDCEIGGGDTGDTGG